MKWNILNLRTTTTTKRTRAEEPTANILRTVKEIFSKIGNGKKMSNLIIVILDFIGSPIKNAREEKETKGTMWRRLSASPFCLMPKPKFLPSFLLLFIKLIFSYSSNNNNFGSNLRQEIPTRIYYIFHKYTRIRLCVCINIGAGSPGQRGTVLGVKEEIRNCRLPVMSWGVWVIQICIWKP